MDEQLDTHRANADEFIDKGMKITPFPLDGIASTREIKKAALLPYRRTENGIEVCLMKPVGQKKELGDTPYEICKGTRMWKRADGVWDESKTDARPEDATPEPLIVTALREASEELNLPLGGILGLRDAGVQEFFSASKPGEKKEMRLFLAEFQPEWTFDAPDAKVSGTEDVKWFPMSKVAEHPLVRAEHKPILARLAEKSALLFIGTNDRSRLNL